jgi:hypothetical protein
MDVQTSVYKGDMANPCLLRVALGVCNNYKLKDFRLACMQDSKDPVCRESGWSGYYYYKKGVRDTYPFRQEGIGTHVPPLFVLDLSALNRRRQGSLAKMNRR